MSESKGLMWSVRTKAGFTQAEMARRMGMGLSAYQEAESGRDLKARHLLVLERVSIALAVERGDINIALPTARRDALDLAKLITEGEVTRG